MIIPCFVTHWVSAVTRGGKNRRAREHCSQEMLNSCRKFVSMKICYWKFEGNLNTHVPLWAQQHMVDRHSSNLKLYTVSQREHYTVCLCTCRFSTKILRWSAGNFCLQVFFVSKLFLVNLSLVNTLSFFHECWYLSGLQKNVQTLSGSNATLWVNMTVMTHGQSDWSFKWNCTPIAPYFVILLCLMPNDFTR
jgi:hypothetical protein